MASQWDSLPQELKAVNQWALTRPKTKAPYKLTNTGLLSFVSVHEPELYDFNTAVALAERHGLQLGFVLRGSDPFTCIDLDVKDDTSSQVLEGYQNLVNAFDSYTETSLSGKGLHIWVQGYIGEGARRDGVEVYSQERFIVCTGNAYKAQPIYDRQLLLAQLMQEMRPTGSGKGAPLGEGGKEVLTDAQIVEMGLHAENGDKFDQLTRGQWELMVNEHGQRLYPSQSEADYALISMLAYYTANNEQVRRVFRCTPLGKREKAVKNDRYIDTCLRSIRARQAAKAEAEAKQLAASANLSAQLAHAVTHPTPHTAPTPNPEPAAVHLTQAPVETPLSWPPGWAGEVARFIYNSSHRPVPEVAIVAALGLLAGICGRSYVISNTGLNLYLVLVARSGIGKEALHSGISHLLNRVRAAVPGVDDFVDFTDYASGPALRKAFEKRACFVNVQGEWGRKLARFASDRADGPMAALRTVMTDVYQKSGPGMRVGGLGYSKADDSTQTVSGVAYSLVGETTPGTFYECLTESMMADGFLSRITTVEYKGIRPAANRNPVTVPSNELTDLLTGLIVQSMTLANHMTHQPIAYAPGVAEMLELYDQRCDAQINRTEDEGFRQLWNRAQLKVCRVVGLLAAADNYLNPVVTMEHLDWAIKLVENNISMFSTRMEAGDVGSGDSARDRKLAHLIERYFYDTPSGTHKQMHEDGVITRSYLQARSHGLAVFRNHKDGSNRALDLSLRAFTDNGYLVELTKLDAQTKYGFSGKLYRVVRLPSF